MSDTPKTDRWKYEQECNYDVPWEDHCRELESGNNALASAARLACENTEDDGDPYCVKMNRRDFDALSAALDAVAN